MHKKPQIVLLVGAPSTGKTSVLNQLSQDGFICFKEISREIVQEARKNGYDHLFKEEPLLFSEKLLDRRKLQYQNAQSYNADFVFIDRGLPDITAYLDMVNTNYPQRFVDANLKFRYDHIFWFPLWRDIHMNDDERYEDFGLSETIQNHLLYAYKSLNYNLIEVPKTKVKSRVEFVLSHLQR